MPSPSPPPTLICKSPTPPPPPKVATPPPRRSPTPPLLDLVPSSKAKPKTATIVDVPKAIVRPVQKVTSDSAPPLSSKVEIPTRRESKTKLDPDPKGSYKPAVLLSGVEKSSDVASPLMKFPTLPGMRF